MMTQIEDALTERIATLRWVVPLVLIFSVLVYELVIARWVHDRYSDPIHFGMEVLFFGTTGPLLAFWALTRVKRWVNAKIEAERQAQMNERRLAAVTSASADAILSLSSEGRIESWNRGAELLFLYSAHEMLGQSFLALLGEDEAPGVEYQWLLDTAQEAGFVRGHETTCFRADGQRVAVELTATHVYDESKRPLGMSLILRDITSRKQREAEIKRLNTHLNRQVEARTRELAEKVAALARANEELQNLDQTRSEFVSLVSHQIRAPLTNVLGAVERMQTDCMVVNTTCSRMFTILNQQMEQLNRLVTDVLNAARIESGDLSLAPEPFYIYPLLQQAAEQISTRATHRTVRLKEKPGLPLIYADRDRIVEVLANLLDNADKFSPAGTDIDLDVRADQDAITISVRDQGSGLPKIALDRVFEKFYRTDNTDSQVAYGYGLGLYVCRRLVEAQQGRIWAENHPGGGAIFSFSLPIWNEAMNRDDKNNFTN